MAGFMDLFGGANGDLRVSLTRFLALDEFINLNHVSKSLHQVVSGRKATPTERKHIYALYVLSPMLRGLKPLAPREEDIWFSSVSREVFDETYNAWLKQPIYERIKTFEPLHHCFGSPGQDIYEVLYQVRANSDKLCHLPLHEFMNTRVHFCALAIRDDKNRFEKVAYGSVIYRLLWSLKEYPSWVQYLLTTVEAGAVKSLLEKLAMASGDLNPFTPFQFPQGCHTYFGTTKNRIDTAKIKDFNKKLLKTAIEQRRCMNKLLLMHYKYAEQRDAQFESDMLIPKVIEACNGTRQLKSEDLDLLLSVLKRQRASKRARE